MVVSNHKFFEDFILLCKKHDLSIVQGAGKLKGGIRREVRDSKRRNPARDKQYLAYITTLPCEGYPQDTCGAMPVQAHHYGAHSMGQKTDDYRTIPLCYKCHDRWHKQYKKGEDEEYYEALILEHVIDYLKAH